MRLLQILLIVFGLVNIANGLHVYTHGHLTLEQAFRVAGHNQADLFDMVWGLVLIVAALISIRNTLDSKFKVRIIHAPIGEAPDWVRESWIGLELPIIGKPVPRRALTVGVISGTKNYFSSIWSIFSGRAKRVSGYAVFADKAVSILASKNPEAAKWWRDNTPHLLRFGRVFLFNEDACSLVPDPTIEKTD